MDWDLIGRACFAIGGLTLSAIVMAVYNHHEDGVERRKEKWNKLISGKIK